MSGVLFSPAKFGGNDKPPPISVRPNVKEFVLVLRSRFSNPRRFVAVAASAPILSFAAACGGDSSVTPSDTYSPLATTSASTSTPEASDSDFSGSYDPEMVFLATLKLEGVIGVPEATAIKDAKKTCESADSFSGLFTSMEYLVPNYGPGDAGALMGAAVSSYCPENEELLIQFFTALVG